MSVTLGNLFLLFPSITCRRCCRISHRALCLCRTTSMGSCRRRVRCPGWSTTTSRRRGPSSSWTSWRRSWASTSTRTSPRRREPCPELSPKWSRNTSTGESQLCLWEPVRTFLQWFQWIKQLGADFKVRMQRPLRHCCARGLKWCIYWLEYVRFDSHIHISIHALTHKPSVKLYQKTPTQISLKTDVDLSSQNETRRVLSSLCFNFLTQRSSYVSLPLRCETTLIISVGLSAILRCGESLQYLWVRNTLLLGNRLPLLPRPERLRVFSIT